MMTRQEMLQNWSTAQKAGAILPCPRCGLLKMGEKISDNALSRRADIYVCDSCGTEEALEDMRHHEKADEAYNSECLSSWWMLRTVFGVQPVARNIYGGYILEIGRTVNLTEEDIDDIMVGALEGGCKYWCDEVRVVEDEYLGEYASEQISRGGSLAFHDAEDDLEYILTLEMFINGFALACKQGYGDDWFDGDGDVDCCQIDAIGADAIIQSALFGSVIYG